MSRYIVLAGVLALTATQALAHHSAAPFDFEKSLTVRGTVEKIDIINPHAHIGLAIADKGGMRTLQFEGHSASIFYRAGFVRGSVKAGDVIVLTYAPKRDGSGGGFVTGFTTPDGKKIGF